MPDRRRGATAPRKPRGRAAGLLAFSLGCLVTLAGCEREPPHVRERLLVWGTEATIDIVGVPATQAQPAIAAVAESMLRLSGEWHAWQPSDLVRINAALRRGEQVEAPPSVIALIDRARPLVRKTGRLFDPGIGELVSLWGFHTDEYPIRAPLPDPEVLALWLRQRPSLLDLQVDGSRIGVRAGSRVQLDFGAIGEGAAVEIAAGVLRQHGINNALLSLGGDTLALGDAGGRPWRVGIQDPVVGGNTRLGDVNLHAGEGLFVSGSYARFRPAPGGERWPHVLDPRTGQPVTGVALTAVIGDDPVVADAASTALMIAGPAEFADLLQRLGLQCAMLLTEQNELLITRAMQRRLQLQREPVALGPPIGDAGDCSSR